MTEPDRHRPADRTGLEREARRLAGQGFRVRDISEMLGLTVPATAELLVGLRWPTTRFTEVATYG